MLRVVPARSAAQAKSYYSHSDYYTEDQERPGVWRGRGAERLGLARRRVDKAAFDALCDNLHPATGGRVTASHRGDRTVGYDFNFHAPKSLSLRHALTDDPDLLAAFQGAVDETMRLVEADMQTRVRKGYAQRDRPTGEMVWARFDHLTARPVGGVPDPHLHSHCFALNMTYDRAEGEWKAGQFRDLKRDAPFYQAVFHAALAARLRGLGLPLERTDGGWEVAGFSRATLEKFSRRTRQVEDAAAARGVTDPAAKAGLGAVTREGKVRRLGMAELRREWAGRLDPGEWVDPREARRPTPLARDDGLDAKAAVDFAARHLFERRSVVAERQLLAEVLRAGLGRVSLAAARDAVGRSDVLVREVGGRRLATTRAVLAEEDRLLALARRGRGREAPLGVPGDAPRREWLSPGQRAAVRHVLTSRDRVVLVRGVAGAGKTTLMREAVEAIERGGRRVLAFAPSADASRGVLRREGFADAETVARLLVDADLQERARGQVLWVDEAGLLGTGAMVRVLELADRLGCRVVLSGDRGQHGSVERGAVLKVLEDLAGLPVAEVAEVRRQQGAYRGAVELLAAGRAADGLDALDALGWVREAADAGRDRQLAADYAACVAGGETALVVSPTHAEGARVTAAVREVLRAAGKLAGGEREVEALTRVDLTAAERGRPGAARPGDVLQFHQNARGFRTGQRVVVGADGVAPHDQAARYQVYRPGVLRLAAGDVVRVTAGGKTRDGHKLETGSLYTVAGFTPRGDVRLGNGWVVAREYGHLAHGYVVTSHAAQGKTVDRVFVAQSSRSWAASSREQFYVSASRARRQVTVYTDDKAALREAVRRGDDRLTATELVGRDPHRDRGRLYARLARAAGAARRWLDRPSDRAAAHAGRREGGRG